MFLLVVHYIPRRQKAVFFLLQFWYYLFVIVFLFRNAITGVYLLEKRKHKLQLFRFLYPCLYLLVVVVTATRVIVLLYRVWCTILSYCTLYRDLAQHYTRLNSSIVRRDSYCGTGTEFECVPHRRQVRYLLFLLVVCVGLIKKRCETRKKNNKRPNGNKNEVDKTSDDLWETWTPDRRVWNPVLYQLS